MALSVNNGACGKYLSGGNAYDDAIITYIDKNNASYPQYTEGAVLVNYTNG
jgi:hypothetical protein